MKKTYLFYDIETTGLNKCFDQVVQFASIRTDLNLNELERHEFFVKLNPDVIPSPFAFITHRIPLKKLAQGLSELEAVVKIHHLLNTPGTISLGYNTLGFDDEFLRFSFYRNLLSPYTHQYANDCSRMDLYPMAVMYFLYKNNSLKWPEKNLKLENLSVLNNLSQGPAHHAMSDVIATLNLARILRQDIKMWDFLCGYFNKQIDLQRCNFPHADRLGAGIMIDGKFGLTQQYQCAVTPLGAHQHYKNQILWLRMDWEKLTQASEEDFQDHSYVIRKKLAEPGFILPMVTRFTKAYLQDNQLVQTNFTWLEKNTTLFKRIVNYYTNDIYPKVPHLDAGACLYENGFLTTYDQNLCNKIHQATPENKMALINKFSSDPLKEIGFRIMGRHFFDYLADEQKQKYMHYVNAVKIGQINDVDYSGKERLSRKKACEEILTLSSQALDSEQQSILTELAQYLCV